jgi:hypothetical protein
MTEILYFGLIFGGMLTGIFGERWRAAWERSEWRQRQRDRRGQQGKSAASAAELLDPRFDLARKLIDVRQILNLVALFVLTRERTHVLHCDRVEM